MPKHKRFIENPYSNRVHILADTGAALCGVQFGDDFVARYNFPSSGNPCGSCLRSRRTTRRKKEAR